VSPPSPALPPALFCDRDGTLIVHRPYLRDPAEVELLPGVPATLRQALADGFRLFLLTNQSGIGRGWFTRSEVDACDARMFELLELPEPGFTGVCVAPEAPDDPPVFRKPSPRYIDEMIMRHELDPGRSWMIGDSLSDVHAGLNAGIRAALLAPERPPGLPEQVWLCSDIPAFYQRLTGAGSDPT
jgi:D-glycero-D-manno-heptose 1,7-bisphosphate phosphatase